LLQTGGKGYYVYGLLPTQKLVAPRHYHSDPACILRMQVSYWSSTGTKEIPYYLTFISRDLISFFSFVFLT